MAFGRDKEASQDVAKQIADLNKSLSELRRTLDSQESEMDELRTKLKMVTDENAQIKRLISDTTQIKASFLPVNLAEKTANAVAKINAARPIRDFTTNKWIKIVKKK